MEPPVWFQAAGKRTGLRAGLMTAVGIPDRQPVPPTILLSEDPGGIAEKNAGKDGIIAS